MKTDAKVEVKRIKNFFFLWIRETKTSSRNFYTLDLNIAPRWLYCVFFQTSVNHSWTAEGFYVVFPGGKSFLSKLQNLNKKKKKGGAQQSIRIYRYFVYQDFWASTQTEHIKSLHLYHVFVSASCGFSASAFWNQRYFVVANLSGYNWVC